MKIPYGLSNFRDIITQGYVYVDKTAYIERLENNGKYHLLLRPRRFGKSLFLSTLWHYYDVFYRDEFNNLFGNLYIGTQPTPLHSRFQVLFMEFSGIDTDVGYEATYQAFNRKIANALQSFLQRYAYPAETLRMIEAEPTPQSRMETFFRIVANQKIVLLIDEYDHFANALLSENLTLFQRMMSKGGFVRSFYETLKTATLTGILDRLFITGVTPIMLDSMTSGFNIAENLSLNQDFNDMVGFTKSEVSLLLQPLTSSQPEHLLADITQWYNGYRFHAKAPQTIYNANMVLYFVKNFRKADGSYPEPMLDENIASDYGKILKLFSIGNRDQNFIVLNELINNGEVIASQRRKFDFDKGFDRNDFISLLAYIGFITLYSKNLRGEIFRIPNYAIRELYYQYFKIELERRNQIKLSNQDISQAVEALALNDDFALFSVEITKALQLFSNRDAVGMDEKHIKVLLLTLLYQTQIYFIQSEREINRKYPDIMLLERSPIHVEHQHLIELKYSKKSARKQGWDAKKQEGIAQVQGYLQQPDIAAIPKLSAWLLLTDGEQVEISKVN